MFRAKPCSSKRSRYRTAHGAGNEHSEFIAQTASDFGRLKERLQFSQYDRFIDGRLVPAVRQGDSSLREATLDDALILPPSFLYPNWANNSRRLIAN